MNEKIIIYFGQQVKVVCDRQCGKAWGINSRPRIEFDPEEPDDYAYLADYELGEAPVDPGTYEGGEAKPSSPDKFPNKWCVRECERCCMSNPGKCMLPLGVKDFSKRIFNMPSRHPNVTEAP